MGMLFGISWLAACVSRHEKLSTMKGRLQLQRLQRRFRSALGPSRQHWMVYHMVDHKNMPDLFSNILASVYTNWQQNGIIPKYVSQRVVTLIKKASRKGDIINNFRPITLLNTETLVKVLAERVKFVIGDLMGDAQTCTILDRKIHDRLRLIHYNIKRVGKVPSMDGALANLDQSKAFDTVALYRVIAVEVGGHGRG